MIGVSLNHQDRIAFLENQLSLIHKAANTRIELAVAERTELLTKANKNLYNELKKTHEKCDFLNGVVMGKYDESPWFYFKLAWDKLLFRGKYAILDKQKISK